MRRPRYSGRLLAFLALLSTAAPRSHAQQPATEGALFLLLPIGARAVGTGQAIVADQPGSEGIWWNPSAIARSDRPEAALHHSETIVAKGDAFTLVLPSSLLGVLGLGANILDYGEQEIRDTVGVLGKLLPRNLVLAATYATPVGRRISAGITYKIVQLRLDCRGGCVGIPTGVASSSALDAGVQADFRGIVPVQLGLAVRNAGPRLQVNDKDQADPLPTRIQLGALYRVPNMDRLAKDVSLHATADVVDNVHFEDHTYRIGATAGYRDRVYVRAGYLLDRENDDGGGPAFGFGIATKNVIIDIATIVEGLSAESGEQPTYFSLRYLF